MVQPPSSMRPSALRKSKSQDTHDRLAVESALTTEGVHREVVPDSSERKWLRPRRRCSHTAGLRAEAFAQPPSSPGASQSLSPTDAKIIHENMSRSQTQPIQIPGTPSTPSTPTIGKGHAHDPLEDTLFLNIGTGADTHPEDVCLVSESPSNVDINVYEAAYEEEVQRIIAQRKDQHRRPTLYLTRRVDDIKRIRDSDCVFDDGQDIRRSLKGGFKSFVQKTKEDIEARGELQKLQEGKEGKLGRTMRNVREAKRLVEEARERVKIEDRERERERSRSSTPVPRTNSHSSVRVSRSSTPVAER
jgi:[calcium/calmodulin-dependent protein kinase] kinase